MYSLGEAETALKGVDVKLNFRKSDKPLNVFNGLSLNSFDYVKVFRDDEFWEFPKRPVWLNLYVPRVDSDNFDLAFSVTVLGDGRFCLFMRVHKEHILTELHYYELGVITGVFSEIISMLQKYVDLKELDMYVELDLQGYC